MQNIRFEILTHANSKKVGEAEIAISRKYSSISTRHPGYIRNGKEDTFSELVKKWTLAYENYTFSKIGKVTKFEDDVVVTGEVQTGFFTD